MDPTGRRTVRRNVKDLPAQAWFLIAGSFINRFASFAIVFLVLYLTRLGFSIAEAGIVITCYGIGETLAAGLGGHLADRLGRRTTIAISMFSSAAAMIALSRAHDYVWFLVIAFLAGIAAELYRPAGGALMADLVPEGQRVTAFALLRLGVNLGFAFGSALAGFLANESFLWLFWTDAATSIIYGVIAIVALPEGTHTQTAEERSVGSYRALLADRAFLLFLLGSVLIAYVYFQQQATLPVHVTDVAHLSRADFGMLLSLNGLLVVAFELPISAITMRLPARRVIAAGFLLVGVGFGLTGVANSLPLLMLTVCIWTAGEMVGAPVGYAYVADMAPRHMRGRYQGLYGLAWGSGSITGPAIGTFFFARDPSVFWASCALVGGLSMTLALMGRQARPAPDGPPEAPPKAPPVEAARTPGLEP